MYNPVSTYRVQLHKGFTFSHLENIINYLHLLGIKTIYASPIFQASPGSTHGYDVVDPHIINPEIGDEAQFKKLMKICREKGIGWLQDIVPNHMAYHPSNKYLMDVLENGIQSPYHELFDFKKTAIKGEEKMMVPFLGTSLEEALEKNVIKVALKNNEIKMMVHEDAYPVNIFSFAVLFDNADLTVPVAIMNWSAQLKQLSEMEDEAGITGEIKRLKQEFISIVKNVEVSAFLNARIKSINESPLLVKEMLEKQLYRFCYWKDTSHTINFRRFFTVNSLISMNVQRQPAFEFYHSYLNKFLEEGWIEGLRVDHIDGLNDPEEYLHQLRKLSGKEEYIVIEKILELGEKLIDEWPIQGTSGYEFLSLVNNLFTNAGAKNKAFKFYTDLVGDHTSIHQQIIDKKSKILFEDMVGDLQNLLSLFYELNLASQDSLKGISGKSIEQAIALFLIHCPVYRFYGNRFPLNDDEAAALSKVFNNIKPENKSVRRAIKLLANIFLYKPTSAVDEYNKNVAVFYKRCMQFTGPLMAKGVEDTLMYTYSTFIGHNEVGDAPDSFGIAASDFHKEMGERQAKWPLALNATSTHDTKRGEDARARLNVISDVFEDWQLMFEAWRKENQLFNKGDIPDLNMEYFIAQSLVAHYPLPGSDVEDFKDRLNAFLNKSLREGKVHSNWGDPNVEYEKQVEQYVTDIMQLSNPGWGLFLNFFKSVTDHGIINSLSQVILKCTCPGVPDFYQGCESWNFNFVDPDNRRPVDYEKLNTNLESFGVNINMETFVKELWHNRNDGNIKCWMTNTLLKFRDSNPKLFAVGEYSPLECDGIYKAHVVAFMRKYRNEICVVVVPLSTAVLCKEQSVEINRIDWKDTHIVLPKEANLIFDDVLLNRNIELGNQILVDDCFSEIPFCILKGKIKNSKRSAGVLMHITSLPGNFGIGDLGPEAFAFADFLDRTNQDYWQILPLNPINESQGWSPYSSICSRAGNPLLVSPEELIKEGLVVKDDVEVIYQQPSGKVDYNVVEQIKEAMLDKAWASFRRHPAEQMQSEFYHFKQNEKEWIDDFAMYILLKKHHGNNAWYNWDKEFKNRESPALDKFSKSNEEELDKQKWIQFIFFKQWLTLKSYCNKRGIKLFGDLPFYVSHDSMDVWVNRGIFSVDEKGMAVGVAGVPPDMFSADGQLWGMPVFNWKALKKSEYKWWVERLRKNHQLFDLIRLDHFRAFADYWEVPAKENTAKNGVWKKGPGSHFFKAIKKQLGELPFVAEDLGEITPGVYKLRDDYNLPGMKVLQFAFNKNLTASEHAPHHHEEKFIVYTGTHDNNTLVGWFNIDLSLDSREILSQYAGVEISNTNVGNIVARMAFASVAEIAILPLQDLLGLDENARMNTPSLPTSNWTWRLIPNQLNNEIESTLKEWTWLYNRD